MFKNTILLTLSVLLLACQASNEDFESKLVKTLKEKPDILTNLIEENPYLFITSFQNAAKNAQKKLADKRNIEEQKKLEENYKKPLTPKIASDEISRGPRSAPLVLVEYTDFECPFCKRGNSVVSSLRDKYGDKIQVISKHLPLSFHKNAMISAKYYEALKKQDSKLAFKFYDQIFLQQSDLRRGEKFLKEISKKIGANMIQLEKDIQDPSILEKIKSDMKEAQEFGIQGTPGFVLNGILIPGALPQQHFEGIISELNKRGLVNL